MTLDVQRATRQTQFAIVGFTCLILCKAAGAQTPTTLEAATESLRHSHFRALSAQSCAANSCHGNARPGIANPYACQGSEYPLWVERDPHAHARQTLCSEKSAAMLERLEIMEHGEIIDQAGYDNCLKCHTTTGASRCDCEEDAIHEGVGCAACHGPAEAWVGTHYKPHFGDVEKATTGFVQLEDLVVRARMCASCHIGDADRDMNHDLIAAGHPPLRYEFATYHNRLPKHWRDEQSCVPQQYEAQLWLAGQIAALETSLTLLESRASEGNEMGVWPELAEYDCGSCHHAQRLVGSGARGVSTGLARYSRWNQTGVRMLGDPSSLIDQLDYLQSIMESKAVPDADRVVDASRATRQALDVWLLHQGQHLLLDFDAAQLNSRLTTAAVYGPSLNWESAAQFYLAAMAGRDVWPGGRFGTVRHDAHLAREALRLSSGFDTAKVDESDGKDGNNAAARVRALLESVAPHYHH